MKKYLSLAVLVFSVGCSDSSNGKNGIVRFSQMVDFIETKGFEDSVATGRTVLLRLENADGSLIEKGPHQGMVKLNLEARGLNGGTARVFPLGFAQFGLLFENEGSYELIAKEDDKVLDSMDVTVKNMDALRAHRTIQVVTEKFSATKLCAKTQEMSLDSLTLHRNQRFALNIVPTRDNKPLVGFLGLIAKGSDFLEFDVPPVVEGTTFPNQLMVAPKKGATIPEDAEIIVTEQGGLETTIRFKTTGDEAAVDCVSL